MNPTLGSFVCNLSAVLGAPVGGLGATGTLPASSGAGGLVTDGGDQLVTDGGDRLVFG